MQDSELPRSWADFLRSIDTSGMSQPPSGGPDQPGGILAIPMSSTPAMEAMVMMYVVGLMEMLADNPRAKKRVLAHIAGMNGLNIETTDRRKK